LTDAKSYDKLNKLSQTRQAIKAKNLDK